MTPMAEGVLFNLAADIIKKLSSLASQQLGMLWGVKDELTELRSSVSAIKAVVLDAEERQTKSHFLKDWLEKLKEALYDAEDVLDEISCEAVRRGRKAKQVRIFFSRYNPIAFDYKITRQIKNVRERLEVIAAERKNFHLTEIIGQKTQHGSFDQIHMGAETHSFSNNEEVIGRDDHKRVIKDLLQDMNVKDNISFIAIVGMSGIGKTTLARSLFNDSQVSQCFDLKIWVWVSQNFEVKIVVEKIIESATNSRPNVHGMESLQTQLQKMLQGKKYLLVMDDIWNESEQKWFELKNLLMGGARGSKIMITKRDSTLAVEISNMTSLITLKGLSESDSWSLFKKVAFMDGIEPENPKLIQLGKEILVKCGGVPLVIRHIGRLLYIEKSEEEWISFKNNQLLEVIQRDHDMASILKLSYNHLPSKLKQCFAYSSLLLKYRLIHKDELIRQWVAQGFVQSLNGCKSMEDTGNDYFMELCWRFFYENFNDEHNFEDDVYIHDVMHDLARMVAGNEYVGGNQNHDHVVGESTRHILFDREIGIWEHVPSKLRKAKGLRTFILSNDILDRKNQMNEVVLDELFCRFSRLRVLDLKYSNIKRVPDSIKRLTHLRYLDLSGNYMKSLPNSVTALVNLQTLNLKQCYALKKLPRGTRNLVNLRHLNISDSTHLTHMPEGMGKLTCLQTLSSFVLDSHSRRLGSKLIELNGLNDLRGSLEIIGLENLKFTPSEASLANLKEKKGLRHLTLIWKNLSGDEHRFQADEEILAGLEPNPAIESFRISGYFGVKLPNWLSLSSPLMKLTRIMIVNCKRLQNLPQIQHLPALKSLYLVNLTSLKFIDNTDPYSSALFFPSLESLCLMDMPNLEAWWERESMVEEEFLPTFPCLTILSISNCPKLATMPEHPPLTDITLDGVGLQMMSSIRSSSNSSPSSSLKSLELKGIEDLQNLSHKLRQNLNSLKFLYITECENLVNSLFDDTRSSSSTSTRNYTELGDAMQWKFLHNLKFLRLENLPKLVSLPIEVQHWTALKFLIISKCPNFSSLPEWIGELVSLQELEILECPKLKSLPEGIRELKALNHLRIAGCRELEERCREGGEDWPKIAHVPHFWRFLSYYKRYENATDFNTHQPSLSSGTYLYIIYSPVVSSLGFRV